MLEHVRLYFKPAPWEAVAAIIGFPAMLAFMIWMSHDSFENALIILGVLAAVSFFWPVIYKERFRRHPEVLKKHPDLPKLYRFVFAMPLITFLAGLLIYLLWL